jgi:hypothetical protein
MLTPVSGSFMVTTPCGLSVCRPACCRAISFVLGTPRASAAGAQRRLAADDAERDVTPVSAVDCVVGAVIVSLPAVMVVPSAVFACRTVCGLYR